jgi:amino acid transporter
MKRNINLISLLFVSVSAMLGSGWLFGSFYAAKYAGSASIISWIIGSAMICFVAFVYGEICALIPVSGSSVRMPNYTHGNVSGMFFSLMIWISYIALMVVEIQAVVQYLSFFYPKLTAADGGLSFQGYITAMILMFIVATINNYSVKWMIKCNSFLTLLKIIVPIGISVIFLYCFFSIQQIAAPAHTTFAPFGMHGVFMAISSGGVIFSFNAFKQAAELAGEAKKPHVTVPIALIGSILLCTCIYLLLQTGFISALNSTNLANGWAHLYIPSANSPFAGLIVEHKMEGILIILFFAAVISPFAAALMYCTGGARSLYGIASFGYAPKAFLQVNKNNVPFLSIWVNLLIGMVMFLFFKGWDMIATFLTCLFAISYALAPISMLALRFQVPKMKRPFKLPFGLLWGYLAFFLCSLFVYWCGWDIISKVDYFLLLSLAIIIFVHILNKIVYLKSDLNWKAATWIWPYLIGISAISYMGYYGNGHEILSPTAIIACLAILCLICSYLAVTFRLPGEKTLQHIKNDLNL